MTVKFKACLNVFVPAQKVITYKRYKTLNPESRLIDEKRVPSGDSRIYKWVNVYVEILPDQINPAISNLKKLLKKQKVKFKVVDGFNEEFKPIVMFTTEETK